NDRDWLRSYLKINADKEKLWRVFSNLIMNAIKFSHSGKSVYIHVEKYLNEIVVNVQDEGIGIPEKYYSKVFDMFAEAKRKGTFGEQPFGIGLHICKQIVEAHNGKIWFISNEPIGTSFYVSLPIN
ncbi:MAG TPA: ATP-binding protein, partial [Chitinophagaceae bacterium]|nr:ATP-binding protein [Chitinophagaceae bacterium]